MISGNFRFQQLVAGITSTCGLTTDGTAYCWGFNLFGQLGDGTTADRPLPTPVLGGLTFSRLTSLTQPYLWSNARLKGLLLGPE